MWMGQARPLAWGEKFRPCCRVSAKPLKVLSVEHSNQIFKEISVTVLKNFSNMHVITEIFFKKKLNYMFSLQNFLNFENSDEAYNFFIRNDK